MVTLEFPHLLRLIERRQFDTIYHEHFSYLDAVDRLAGAGMRRPARGRRRGTATHGGSLRVYARPVETAGEPSPRVRSVLEVEAAAGLHTVDGYAGFAGEVLRIKSDLLAFLLTAASEGKSVAGYGAPGKGNTLLNHCGIRSDLLAYTVDRSPVKQGKFLPGTHIPIYSPDRLARDAARLHSGPAVESAKGDYRAAGLHAVLGRTAGFPVPRWKLSEERPFRDRIGRRYEGRPVLRWPRHADA